MANITLRGYVFYDDGGPVTDATVELFNQSTGAATGDDTTTDSDGMWEFVVADTITYKVRISKEGKVRWVMGDEAHQVGLVALTGSVTASSGQAWDLSAGTVTLPASALGTLSPSPTGTWDFSGGTVKLPTATSPAPTAEGSAAWDSDDDTIKVGTGAATKEFGYLGSTIPSALGTAAAGTSKEVAHADHVHPGSTTTLAHVYNNATTTVPNETDKTVTFNSERSDTDGYHSTSSNTERLTVPTGKAGRHEGQLTIKWNSNTSGIRVAQVLMVRGGTTYTIGEDIRNGSAQGPTQPVPFAWDAEEGDYIYVNVWQDSGNSRALNASSATDLRATDLWIRKTG